MKLFFNLAHFVDCAWPARNRTGTGQECRRKGVTRRLFAAYCNHGCHAQPAPAYDFSVICHLTWGVFP
jgi:hypothetical protein